MEFETHARGKRFRTRELVRLDEPSRRIDYTWIEGPLPFVEETIAVQPLLDGSSELHYQGRYATGRGPIKCLLGKIFVRGAFDRAVREHLAEAKAVAERRAVRSKVFPPTRENPGT